MCYACGNIFSTDLKNMLVYILKFYYWNFCFQKQMATKDFWMFSDSCLQIIGVLQTIKMAPYSVSSSDEHGQFYMDFLVDT